MCTNLKRTPTGQMVACRRCGECIKVNKWDWVARAIGETNTNKWGGVISLSYNESQESRDGKLAFRYRDVQNLLKRLREHTPMRYLVAGERGSKRNRVHWHCIFWAPVDIFEIGRWSDFDKQWAAGFRSAHPLHDKFPRTEKYRTRLLWDQWPFGHVFLDICNQQTAEYVVKYAQKDRFNAVKSRGQKHEAKSEVTAAGMFRMSKFPPLGSAQMAKTIDQWKTRLHVPPSGQVTIPGMKGTWYPRGSLRDQMTLGLADVYNTSIAKRGKHPQGWLAMIARNETSEPGQKLNDKIWEALYGEETQTQQIERSRLDRQQLLWKLLLRRCTKISACETCRARLGDRLAASHEQYSYQRGATYHQAREQIEPILDAVGDGRTHLSADEWHRHNFGLNPFCKRAQKARMAERAGKEPQIPLGRFGREDLGYAR